MGTRRDGTRGVEANAEGAGIQDTGALRGRVAELEAEVARRDHSNSEMRLSLAAKERQLDERDRTVAARDQTIEKQQWTISFKDSENYHLTRENRELQAKNTELTGEVRGLTAELAKASAEVRELRGAGAEHAAELARARAEIAKLTDVNANLAADNDAQRAELARERAESAGLRADLAKVRAESGSPRAGNAELGSQAPEPKTDGQQATDQRRAQASPDQPSRGIAKRDIPLPSEAVRQAEPVRGRFRLPSDKATQFATSVITMGTTAAVVYHFMGDGTAALATAAVGVIINGIGWARKDDKKDTNANRPNDRAANAADAHARDQARDAGPGSPDPRRRR